MELKLDPWGAVNVTDYSRLFEEFGISSFDDILPSLDSPHPYMRRKIIFGHRNYDSVLHAMQRHEPFAVMSGFMPTGRAHFGHMMVMNEIIWHQQQGGDAFAAVADMEAHAVRGISWERCKSFGIDEYLVSLIALGFEPGPKSHIYFQSQNCRVRDLAFELGREANFSEVSAIYGFSGETHISHMESVMVQSADILHPQLEEFGGPKPVVSTGRRRPGPSYQAHPRPCLPHEKVPRGAARGLHQHPGQSSRPGADAGGGGYIEGDGSGQGEEI